MWSATRFAADARDSAQRQRLLLGRGNERRLPPGPRRHSRVLITGPLHVESSPTTYSSWVAETCCAQEAAERACAMVLWEVPTGYSFHLQYTSLNESSSRIHSVRSQLTRRRFAGRESVRQSVERAMQLDARARVTLPAPIDAATDALLDSLVQSRRGHWS